MKRRTFNYLATLNPRHPKPEPTAKNPLGLTKRRIKKLERIQTPTILQTQDRQIVAEYSDGTRYQIEPQTMQYRRVSPRAYEIRKAVAAPPVAKAA